MVINNPTIIKVNAVVTYNRNRIYINMMLYKIFKRVFKLSRENEISKPGHAKSIKDVTNMVSYHNTRRVDKNIYKSINLSRVAFSFRL